jgi:hypothetical protein
MVSRNRPIRLEYHGGVSRDCSRRQRAASTIAIELRIVRQALPTTEPVAKLVAITPSKRRLVWRTFVTEPQAGIRNRAANRRRQACSHKAV